MDTTPASVALGQSITAARIKRKLGGRELARLVGIDHGYLWRIEHGRAATLERYDSIAKALGMVLVFRFRPEKRAA